MRTVISPALLFLLVCDVLRADVSPAPLFCDGAVLQRGKPVPVWGTAAPGERVSVAFAGNTLSTVAGAGGQWRATLPAMPASGEPRDLIISGNNRIDIKNVVVGEVWLASGQSNMERILRRTYSGDFETAAAIHPPVRHFKVAWKVSHVPLGEAGGKWEEASAAAVGEFTAVGYHFAGALWRALGVPVGIINSSWGGTRIEAWMDREAAGASNGAEFALIYERWREVLKNYPAARAGYEAARAAWEKERDAAAENGGAFSRRPPPPPPGPGHQDTPCGLYNGMIHPLVPYAMSGMLWYQGESNAGRADEYHAFFSAMIHGWRRAFGQGELPFYWVQLANYKHNGAGNADYALLREAQARTLALPRTGQAVTIDIGDVNDIHPLNKREVGWRLARLALARDYGLASIADSGPEFRRAGRERDGMRVFFKPSKSPLASPRGVLPAGFELAGADGAWHPAAARIEGGTIFAGSPAAPRPAAVRYAWKNAPEAGLFNEAGLPAAPFRAVVPPGGEAPAAELAARLRHYIDGQIMAGAVLLVADAKSGRVLAREALGRADIAAARPMRADDVFWVASMTKPVTAAAFMMLVDEGRAGLDDPVEKYIPGFNNDNLKVAKPGGGPPSAVIRVRHLLSHTAGLRFINTTDKGLIDSVPLKTSVEHVLLDPLEHEPGEKFLYSNAGIDAAGRIIEIVSGMPYEKFLEERLFKPLGMADTTFTPAPGQLRRLAKTYRAAPEGKALAETRTGYLTYPLDAPGRHPSPSGGLFSTAGDMLRFCLMLAGGGVLDGRRYLSEEAVRRMTTKQTGPLVAKDYGLGLGGSPDGKTFGHGGALKTDMMVENGQIRIFMTQHSGNWSTGDPVADFAREARRLFASDVENTVH
ncbi:MAG: serine hydrolase [Opitutaceae bacterium]|jgi:sialate O-acetylesterase|nr:serine hydrolase [Opitutaceae bacterium]